MRKLFFRTTLLSLSLLAIAATEAFATHVDTNTAKIVAKNFWLKQDPTVESEKAFRVSEIASSNGFSHFYLIERTSGTGFVIVSADDCVQPVLGYSLTSPVSVEIPVSTMELFRGYENEIIYCVTNGIAATEEVRAAWQKLGSSQSGGNAVDDYGLLSGEVASSQGTVVVGPLLSTTWNQAPIYNDYCPYNNTYNERTVVGCVATAMAQIMKYWNYPERGIGSNSYNMSAYGNLSANFANTVYDWGNMPNAIYASSSAAQISAVATLSYHCGVAVNMQYNVSSQGGSSAHIDGGNPSAEYALKTYFGYKNTLSSVYRNNYTDVQWNAMLRDELNAGRPLLYGGAGIGGAHAFVCDGYDSDGLFHYNWGWGGNYDGFFASNNLAPSGGGIGSNSSNTFNNNQLAIFGIEPDNTHLVVRPENVVSEPFGGNTLLSVRPSNTDTTAWTAYTDYPWITLSANRGNGSGSIAGITVNVAANLTGYNRCGTITFVQHNDTVIVPVSQAFGNNSVSGLYGNSTAQYFASLDSGTVFAVRPECYGKFNSGDTVKSVFFRTYDNSAYPAYMDNEFLIRIYENPTYTATMAQGQYDNASVVLGDLVYSQNYTQSIKGEQEVVLNTPYVVNNNRFWITLTSVGRSQLLYYMEQAGDTILQSDFPDPSVITGKYLMGNDMRLKPFVGRTVADAASPVRYMQYNCYLFFGFSVSTGAPVLINAKADSMNHGFAYGSGVYSIGDTVTLQAYELPGYIFRLWSDSVSANPRSFVVAANTYYPDFVALYNLRTQYTLSVVSNNPQYGTTYGSGLYYAGDTVSAIAIPTDSTKAFLRWNDNSTTNPRRIAINGNKQLVAYFATRNMVATHDTIRDTLYISGVHDTIHDTAFVNVYVHDTLRDTSYFNIWVHDTIHDTAFVNVYVRDTLRDTSYINIWVHDTIHDTAFVNVYVRDTLRDTLYINVAVHDTIHDTAYINLPQNTFNILSANSQQGVTVGSGTYPQGLRVGIAAVPNEGYRFSHWSDNSTDNPRHFTVSGDVSLTAYFTVGTGINKPDKNFSYDIYPNPTSGFITFSQYAEKVEILDNVGRLVNTLEGSINLDLSALADGTYTLRITSNGNVVIKKVVKQ